jgi:hypothetical protein
MGKLIQKTKNVGQIASSLPFDSFTTPYLLSQLQLAQQASIQGRTRRCKHQGKTSKSTINAQNNLVDLSGARSDIQGMR